MIATTPDNPSYLKSISFWKTYCVEFTLNGSRVQRYRPKDVLNVGVRIPPPDEALDFASFFDGYLESTVSCQSDSGRLQLLGATLGSQML